jgi:hypothetical protein
VDCRVASGHGLGNPRAIGDVSFDQLSAQGLEPLRLLGRADERDHFVAPLAKLAHHMAADEPGSPGDEDLHAGSLSSTRPRDIGLTAKRLPDSPYVCP